MNEWNFRRSWWTGKLILQRYHKYYGDFGKEFGFWKDADVSDLKDYFAAIAKATGETP